MLSLTKESPDEIDYGLIYGSCVKANNKILGYIDFWLEEDVRPKSDGSLQGVC